MCFLLRLVRWALLAVVVRPLCRLVGVTVVEGPVCHRGTRGEHTAHARELHRLLTGATPLLCAYAAANGRPQETPVVRYQQAEGLRGDLGGALALPREGGGEEAVMRGVRLALEHSVRTGHPRFLDKLYAGCDAAGQLAELLCATLNSNVHTFAVAPFLSLVERECVQGLLRKAGFDVEAADGVFNPGGSFSNLTAMVLARHRAPAGSTVVLCSDQAHYSVSRAAGLLGMECVPVPADLHGRMHVSALRGALQEHRGKVAMVSCTAGTTVMGGFDDIGQVVHALQQEEPGTKGSHRPWLHVDACWGGSCLFSCDEERRGLLAGCGQLVDSLSWNPHKGLGVPIFCSVLLVARRGELQRACGSGAEYLFHPGPDSDFDLGDKSLQCGRRGDALKLWLCWQRHGERGFSQRVDAARDLALHLLRLLRERSDRFWLVVQDPQWCNVCFWYVPRALRNAEKRDPQTARVCERAKEMYAELDAITLGTYHAMQRKGSMLVNFNPLAGHGLPRFFRVILNQPSTRHEDLEFVLREIEELAEGLGEEPQAQQGHGQGVAVAQ